MGISFEQQDFLGKKYHQLECLLLYFLMDTYLPSEEADYLKTIQKYVATFDGEVLKETIEQTKALVHLDPFPAEWIWNVILNSDDDAEDEEDREICKNWIKDIIKMLEEEGHKAGKL